MAAAPQNLLAIVQFGPFLAEHGYVISYSTISKDCAAGRGPPVAYVWGNRKLSTPRAVLAWARSRMRPADQASRRKRAGAAVHG
jgi:hypothetical protein